MRWIQIWHDLESPKKLDPSIGEVLGRGRKPIDSAYRIGRRVFKPCRKLEELQIGEQILADSGEIQTALWNHRKGIWAACCTVSDRARELFRLYVDSKDPFPECEPMVLASRVKGLILAAQGSIPGGDEFPYELHPGASFVALLVVHAIIAATWDHRYGRVIVGEPVDLLVWIPKILDAILPDDLWPLQIHTCIRRIFRRSYSRYSWP